MRLKLLVALAAVAAVALPAGASASGYHGVVVAKQARRGVLVLALPGGRGLTVRAASLAGFRVGERIGLQGKRLSDGSIRASRLTAGRRLRTATIRGVVVRQLPRSTLVATGRSVIRIHHARVRVLASRSDSGLSAGTVARFDVRFGNDDELEQTSVTTTGQTGTVRIEGVVQSVTPFVVSVEGLPVTITVPAGTSLPATLAAGQRIELNVSVGDGNAFTLVSIDEAANAIDNEDENENENDNQGDEVEAQGPVVSSTASQLVVSSDGKTFTFAAPSGQTLPIIPVGTIVEAKGTTINGVLTLERVKTEDESGDSGSGSTSGSDEGGHDGGGDD